ncbi:MAG TPA: hypothetical protein VD927_02055, partial [Chryseosolibacter sp.]|nr:hypothetical protein [Chryseosolibacter sp.]
WSDYEFTFMLAVENILKKEFEAARNQLTLLSDADFDWQVKLLEIDCARELGQAVDVLKEYQMVYDSAQNPIVKELAKTRYRIYKYGK